MPQPLSSTPPTAQPSYPALLPGTHRYTFEMLLAAAPLLLKQRGMVEMLQRETPAVPTATLTQWSSGSSSRAAPALSSPASGMRSLEERAEDRRHGSTANCPASGAHWFCLLTWSRPGQATAWSRHGRTKSPYGDKGLCKGTSLGARKPWNRKGWKPKGTGRQPGDGKGELLHPQSLLPHCRCGIGFELHGWYLAASATCLSPPRPWILLTDSRSLPPSLPQRWSPAWPQQKPGRHEEPVSLDASLGPYPAAIGNPNQAMSNGPGLGGNSKAHVTPKRQKDQGTSWERSYSVIKIQRPYYCKQPHPNPSCCSTAKKQHPWGPSTHGKLMLIHTGPPVTAALTPLAETSAPVCREKLLHSQQIL